MRKIRPDVRAIAAAALASIIPARCWADYTSISMDTTNPAGSSVIFANTSNNGDFVFSNNATYFNQGTFTAENDSSFTGAGTFSNTGFFNKYGTSGTTNFAVPFIGGGATQVSQGFLSFNDGGVAGVITIAPTATLEISSSNSFTGGTVTSNGYFEPMQGTVSVGAITGTGHTNLLGYATVSTPSIQQSSVIDDGNSLNLTSNAASTVGTFAISNATLAGSAPDATTIQSNPTVLNVMSGASLGNSTLQTGIVLNLNGTTYANGNNIAGDANTVMNVPSGAVVMHTVSSSTYITGVTTNVAGTFAIGGGGFVSFNCPGTQSGTFNIASGSAFAGNGHFTTSAVVNDSGMFQTCSGIAGGSTLFDGTLNVTSGGALDLEAATTFSALSTVNIAAGTNLTNRIAATVTFNNNQSFSINDANLAGTVTFRNAGVSFNTVELTAYALNLETGGTASIGTLNISAGSLTSGLGDGHATTVNVGTLSLASGAYISANVNVSTMMNFSGDLDGVDGTQCTVNILNGATINYSGGTLTRGAVLNNYGSLYAANGLNVGSGAAGLTEKFNTSAGSSSRIVGVLGIGNNGSLASGSGQGSVNATNGTIQTDQALVGSTVGGVGTVTVGTAGVVNVNTAMNVSAGSFLTVGRGGTLNVSNPAYTPSIHGLQPATAPQAVGGILSLSGTGSEVQAGGLIIAQQFQLYGASPLVQLDSDTSTPGTISLPASANISFTGTGAASITNYGTGTVPGTIDLQNSNNHMVTVSPGSSLTISAQIVNGGMEVMGGGTLLLTGANNGSSLTLDTGTTVTAYSGAVPASVNFSGGTLALRGNSASQNFGVSLNSNTSTAILLDINTISQTGTGGIFAVGAINSNSSSSLGVTGSGTLLTSAINLVYSGSNASPYYINTTANLTAARINDGTGSANLVKAFNGTLTLGGTSSGTDNFGTMNVASGTLVLDEQGIVAIPHDLLLYPGSTVRLALSNQIASTSNVTLSPGLSSSLLDLNGNSNTLGSLNFVAGGMMNTGSGTATLTTGGITYQGTSGTALINGNLNLGTTTPTFSISSTSTAPALQINANISGGSGVGITKTGSGILYLTGNNTFTGPLSISGGSVKVDGTLSMPLMLNSMGVINLDANPATGILIRQMNTISISGSLAPYGQLNVLPATNRANRQLIVTSGLSIGGAAGAWQGKVDLANNDMIVQGGSLANLTSQIQEGYNAGTWTGIGGIVSSNASSDSRHLTTLGVIQNNQSGTALYTSAKPFDTDTAVATADILLKYTYYGDTNLDGKIDASDYSRIDSAFLADKTNATAATGWFNGDFNYDGVINGSDYTLIDNAFNTQGAALSAKVSDPVAVATAQIASVAAVPEPTMLGLFGIGSAAIFRRRRRVLR